MKAVILCNNEGTRLRPITCSIPPSMLPVMGRPVIEHTVKLLARCGIDNVTVSSDYLRDEIKKHFSAKADISFTEICNLNSFFQDDDTVLISGNLFTDLNFTEVLDKFHKSPTPIIITKPDGDFCEYGCVFTDISGYVTKYVRCPDPIHSSGSVFAGIAVIPKGTNAGDCRDLQTLAEKLSTGKVLAISPTCYIRNISDFDSYHRCTRDFMDKKISLSFPCEEKAPGVWIEENATVMQGSVIVPPVYIGSESFISKGARIESYTQIGSNVNVDCFAGIKRSIIMDNTILGEGCEIRGAIIGKNCSVGYESAAYEGSVIGFGTKTGKHCVLRSSVHIWPEKFIEDESTVCENLIWENTTYHSLFSDGSATGIINREITPEFAATLGRSAVSLLGKKIAVSEDGTSGSSMIKNALISGIQSAGGKPYDMGEQPLPITRSAIRFYSLDGGIALSTHNFEGNLQGSLDIINSLGANIEANTLQELSNLTSSKEAKRELASNICDTEYLFEYKLFYLKQLVNSTSEKPLNAKLLINCQNLWGRDLLQSAAKDLKCSFTFTDNRDEDFYKHLKSGDFDFGAICDYKCETLTIVTKTGRKLSEFEYCALTSLIIMKSFPDGTLYVPESAPESIEKLAEKYSFKVHRTKVSPPYLMNELSKSKEKLFLHQFIYRFDAVGAIILLLDFLHKKEITVEELLSEIPVTHMISTHVSCSQHIQPEIIKKLCSKHSLQPDDSKDAIKVTFENGWVLLVPKRNESAINVISHAYSVEYAQEISDIFTDEISKE